MTKKCALCGSTYGTFAFGNSHVCENCVQYLKTDFQMDALVRSED